MRKEVTIKQVAKVAGVSSMTVSRVLNDRPDVSPTTRKHVKRIINELGYAPSVIARNLSQGRSSTIGVVSSQLEFFGPSRTLVGVERQANKLGYSLMIRLLYDPLIDRGEAALNDLLAHQVAGIIWAVAEIGNQREWLYDHLGQISTPIMFLGMQPRPEVSLVAVDNFKGGQLATKHLLDQGCQKIGIITGPEAWWEARQREQGWRAELETAVSTSVDTNFDDLRIVGNWTAASGEACMQTLLARVPDLDAVFVCNDSMALGALKAAKNAGRSVPQDLAIVGFDDIPESAYFSPSLTTVRQDLLEQGCQAVSSLFNILKARQNDLELDTQVTWIEPKLVVRNSSMRNAV